LASVEVTELVFVTVVVVGVPVELEVVTVGVPGAELTTVGVEGAPPEGLETLIVELYPPGVPEVVPPVALGPPPLAFATRPTVLCPG